MSITFSYYTMQGERSHRYKQLNVPEEYLLDALANYHFLTSEQACRLRYSKGSLRYVQRALKRLAEAGYVQKLFLPRTTQAGSAPSVHHLARLGLNHLRARGVALPRRYHAGEVGALSYLFLRHTLAVNDLLIGLELLCRREAAIEHTLVLHERLLKRQPSYVTIDTGDGAQRRVGVIPDAYIDLRVHTRLPYRTSIAFEVDLSTEDRRRFRRKVRTLTAWWEGPYQEVFQSPALLIAVLAVRGAKRRDDLRRWTEEELRALGKERLGGLFVFAAGDPATLPPEQLFVAPRWYEAFNPKPLPLLEGLVAP